MTILSSNELQLSANTLDQGEILTLLQGTRNAQSLTISLFVWFAYEYIITSALEYEFFWKNREWTRGRGLFFTNRYTAWLAMISSLYIALIPRPTLQVCTRGLLVSLFSNLLCIGIGQAYICNKFWNIFEHQRIIQASLVIGIVLSVSISLLLLSISTKSLTVVMIAELPAGVFSVTTGCKAKPPEKLWASYIPPLILHIYLYCLAIFIAITNRDFWDMSKATRKVLWDGTAIFLVALVTFLLTITFAAETHIPWLSIPATFSPIVLPAASITLTREAIATRMLLMNQTSILTSARDSVFGSVELMPMATRDQTSRRRPARLPTMQFAGSTRSTLS